MTAQKLDSHTFPDCNRRIAVDSKAAHGAVHNDRAAAKPMAVQEGRNANRASRALTTFREGLQLLCHGHLWCRVTGLQEEIFFVDACGQDAARG